MSLLKIRMLAPVVVLCALATASCGDDSAPGRDDAGTDQDKAAGYAVAADRAGNWAGVSRATIAPGVQTYTEGAGQCTANFVFVDRRDRVYVGQAAHCAGQGESSETNGCRTTSLPLGTPVTFRTGGSALSDGTVVGSGTLAYSSWIAMRERGERDQEVCSYNDFALILVDAASLDSVNPTVPFWGGPVGLSTSGVDQGESVHSYGNSSLRGGLTQLSPQTGTADAEQPARDGWAHDLHAPTPGIPGDSGSAYLDADGSALGTLSTLGLTIPVTNTIGDLYRELAYAREHSGIEGLRLVLGTRAFRSEGWGQADDSAPSDDVPDASGDDGEDGEDAQDGSDVEGDCRNALSGVPGLTPEDITRACAQLGSAEDDVDGAAKEAACAYAVSSVPEGPPRDAAYDACLDALA